jgi:hypothetical protein
MSKKPGLGFTIVLHGLDALKYWFQDEETQLGDKVYEPIEPDQ